MADDAAKNSTKNTISNEGSSKFILQNTLKHEVNFIFYSWNIIIIPNFYLIKLLKNLSFEIFLYLNANVE